MMKKFVLIFLLLMGYSYGQSKDPDVILNRVKENFNRVKDYVVDVKIKVDVPFLKAPESEAKIYFKQPDKIHVESKSFALLPKEGVNISPLALLKDKYTAIYDRDEKVDGYNTSVVKVIPLGEKGNIVLTTFWIDQSKNIIRKVESTTKFNGTFTLELKYDDKNLNYPLPAEMIFKFNADRINIHRRITDDDEKTAKENKISKPGVVYLNYSNYKINKGIPDNIFVEKKRQ